MKESHFIYSCPCPDVDKMIVISSSYSVSTIKYDDQTHKWQDPYSPLREFKKEDFEEGKIDWMYLKDFRRISLQYKSKLIKNEI